MPYVPPKNDPEYSQKRLNGIMGRRRLSFNPYTVSDRRLLEIAWSTGWGNDLDITQIVVLTFTRLRETGDYRKFDGIYFRIGHNPDEGFIPAGALAHKITANDTVRQERTWIGKRPLRHIHEVPSLVGKTVFVSRIIRGVNQLGTAKGAYKMHRLTGNQQKDARVIREAMIAAKIEMLGRILDNPQSPDYLSCRKGLIDYEPRIRLAIDLIRRFPDTPIPED